jgi:ribosomal protein L15
MRHYCWHKNNYVCPRINVEKLWSILGEDAYKHHKANKGDKVPVVDCVKAGFFKVCGKGELPADMPLIVKARYFSKDAEKKIKAAGGACVLTC